MSEFRPCPKPEPAPVKARAANSTLPRPSKPMARGRMKARNAARRDREFARTYHSAERVEWIKQRPCVWCVLKGLKQIRRPSDNAHTEREGMGRKGHYRTIVPLCRKDHEAYDQHRAPFDRPSNRLALRVLAKLEHRAWAAFTAGAE